MTEDWRTLTQDFKSIDERDKYITEHADYFTVGRRLGPFEGYERHEVKTLSEAENLAGRMANQTKKAYLIYAVAGFHDVFVKAIHPEQTNA
jgi:hypothetical protein